jgi:hypothetical protein
LEQLQEQEKELKRYQKSIDKNKKRLEEAGIDYEEDGAGTPFSAKEVVME